MMKLIIIYEKISIIIGNFEVRPSSLLKIADQRYKDLRV